MGNTTCCNRLDVYNVLFDKKNYVEVNNLIIKENISENVFEKSYKKIIKLQNNWRGYKARCNFLKLKSELKYDIIKIPGLELSKNQMINRCTKLMEETEKKLGPFDPQKKISIILKEIAESLNILINTNYVNSNNNLTSNHISNINSSSNEIKIMNIYGMKESNFENNWNILNNKKNYYSNNNFSNNDSQNYEKKCDKNIEFDNIPLRTTSILYPDNTIYTGSYNYKWEKQGLGTLFTKENAKITGLFREDKLFGRGRIIYPEGDYFEGEFLDDKLYGIGEYLNTEGVQYRGEWREDMKNGLGEEKHPDGTIYIGEFLNDFKHGTGRFKWRDGSVFEGSIVKNQIEGIGKMIYFDNQFYKGEWKFNKIEGRGIFIWPDKRVYIGYYKNEKKWGYGIFIWPNGRRYEGQWLNGRQHGFGICHWDQKKQLSEWRLGKKQKMQNDSIEEMKNKIVQINYNISDIIGFCKNFGLDIDPNFGYIKIDGIQILYELSAPPTNNNFFLSDENKQG